MANTVRILVTAKDEISGTLDKIRDKASVLSKTDIGRGMVTGAGIAAFGALQNAAFMALDGVKEYVAGSVEAFREEEVGIKRLGASLTANVKDWDGNTDAIERQIDAMVRTTGFSDGEMRDSLARLVASTHDVNKAFDLQRTAMDLARFKGISLADASAALIKVEGGQYRALKELGIVLEKGASQTEALAAVQKVAGGQMAAYAETTAAKTEILNNRLEDLQEEVGEKLSGPLATATANVLAFMDAVDSDSPLTFEERAKGMVDMLNMLNPMMWANNWSAGQLGEAQAELADQMAAAAAVGAEAWDTGSERVGASLVNISKASGDTSDDVVKDNRKIKRSYEELEEYLTGQYSDNFDTALDVVDARSELSAAKTERDNLAKEIASGKLTKEQEKDAKKRMHDLDVETAHNYEVLATAGALSAEGYDNWKKTVERLAKGTKGKVHDLYEAAIKDIQALKAAAAGNIGVTVSYKTPRSGNQARAAGGYIGPYSAALVNEGVNGTEAIFSTGSSGAYVNPSAAAASAGSGGGGSPVIVQVVLDRRVIAESVAPGVTAWQQGRGLMARA